MTPEQSRPAIDPLIIYRNGTERLRMLADILRDETVQETIRHARVVRHRGSPSFAHCLVKVAVLGAVQKRQRPISLNLGDAARLCELAGENPEVVKARYDAAQAELSAECDWIIDAAVTEFDAQPVAMAAE